MLPAASKRFLSGPSQVTDLAWKDERLLSILKIQVVTNLQMRSLTPKTIVAPNHLLY